MYATKIKMQSGSYSNDNLEEIESIWIEGCAEPGYYTKAAVHNFLQRNPNSIRVNIYPYPYLEPAISVNGEKYVRSKSNTLLGDNLLRLPRR